jgi:mannose-6-phosphate isomerase
MKRPIDEAAEALRAWATDLALPLWARTGFDSRTGRFEERLSFDLEAVPEAPLRLMSQARQIYVYALAARRGWYNGAIDIVEHAFGSMIRDFYRADDANGWIFSIRRDGSPADPRRDLYGHAFALLAIASYVGATGKRQSLALADDTLTFLDATLAAPIGGYLEGLPTVDDIRRQNPHMHLFESLLALWEASGEQRYLDRADRIFGLFSARFFHSEPGVLGEYFTTDLAPAPGEKGRIVEPGHHYEWVWLLRRYRPHWSQHVEIFAEALYRHADANGYDAHGFVMDELLADGSPRLRSRRSWPVTEAIKANIVEAMQGRAGAEDKAVRLTGLLLQNFLAERHRGGWMDRLDAAGMPAVDFMPASTLYHVMGAVDELHRYAINGQANRCVVLHSVVASEKRM